MSVPPLDPELLRARLGRRPAHPPAPGAGGLGLRPAGTEELDVAALEEGLRSSVRGEVRFDAGLRASYAHDSSNYRQAPIGVVLPRDAEDVIRALAACRAHGAPVLPRGCGTSLAGQGCNVAVVIDTSRHMRGIVGVDLERRTARVQPGVIRDQLAAHTEPDHRLTFFPDTSTHAYATFGGMVGNNSCGAHSVVAGRTSDNVDELDVVLYDGTRLRVGETGEDELERIIAAGGRRGEIYARLRALRDRYADRIRETYPDIPRRVSGYNLDELLPENGFHVARALVGSQGTLATVVEAAVRLVHSPPARSMLVCGYPDVFSAADHVPEILESGPMALEGLDDILVDDMRRLHMHAPALSLLPEGEGWLLAEFGGETVAESDARAGECMDRLARGGVPPAMRVFNRPTEMIQLWGVRESGGGATTFVPGEREHWEGWDDAAVAPALLGSYLRRFRALMDRYGYRAAVYGHFGDGCVHCRIDFDLLSAGGLRKWRSFLDEASDLVLEYGGSLSGEHGDGQARAELLPKMFGDELMGAFGEFKAIWDPDNRMNPHKLVDPYPIVSNLRLGAGYNPPEPKTQLAFPEDGGSFAHATLRCVGAGNCRDTSSGTMCPSYMVTLDEQHTTRGRARILYEMLRGDVITDGFRSQQVYEALDLCLACKGCKSECPVRVDMAAYKAEFLSKYFRGRLRPAAAYTMGLVMLHARIAARAPRLANFLTHAPGLAALAKRAGGISPRRELPRIANEPFEAWFARRRSVAAAGEPVLLFVDTFGNFLAPAAMTAAVEVLEAAGHRVLVPSRGLCCGRPLYDYGMLPTARRFLRRLVDVLRPHVRDGTPVVGIEPSCVAVLRDELLRMLPHDRDARRLSMQTLTLAEFLDRHASEWEMPQLRRRAIVHGHCHQKAVMGMEAERRVYERLGLDFEVLDSGCCGMAGAFGFERAHHDISVEIGERRLLPAVRDAGPDTLVVADGFSCQTQIAQLTGRRGLHTAQLVKMAVDQAA
ncbi:MAG: FAD-linked oxidase C-terminal domain-containing protein [Solirubrobacteraceae bacterium]